MKTRVSGKKAWPLVEFVVQDKEESSMWKNCDRRETASEG
jgi:hypothetical protein